MISQQLHATTSAAQTVAFLHVPKTAGTTLFEILERAYPRRRTFHTIPAQPDFGFGHLLQREQAQRDRIRLVAGHMPFGVHRHFSHPVAYFTFLRDPISRSVSDYYFVKKQPTTHYLHEKANSLSLEEYLGYRASIAVDNVHTRMISGVWNTVPFDPDNEEMLEQAKENLRTHFVMVGLTEEFDRSLLILKRILGLRNVYYAPLNITAKRPTSTALSPSTLDVVKEYNTLDLALFQYGQELFAQQVAEYTPSLEQDLVQFQRRNQLLGKLYYQFFRGKRILGELYAQVSSSE